MFLKSFLMAKMPNLPISHFCKNTMSAIKILKTRIAEVSKSNVFITIYFLSMSSHLVIIMFPLVGYGL